MIISTTARKWFVYLFVAALPFVEMTYLVRTAFQRPLSYFSPSLNDEVGYWHQAATFAHAGFHGGYYTFEEHPASASAVHFGVHGPAYPILYGSIGRVTGWYSNSAPVVNAAIVGAAILAFALLTGASIAQVVLLGAVAATFWPLAFFLPSNMQEPLHHAFAIVGGGLVGRALRDGQALPRWVRWAGWLGITVMALTRLSWSVLLVIWALALGGAASSIARRLVVAAAITIVVIAAFFHIAAPIPNSPIAAEGFTTVARIQPIITRVSENLARLKETDAFEPIELWHRAVYAGAVLIAVVALVRGRQTSATTRAAIHLVNLGGIVVAMFVLYAISNMTEIRIIAAHVLLSAAILIADDSRTARALVLSLVAASIAAVSIFWEDFRQNRDANFRRDLRSQRVLEETIEGRVVYQPGESPWCNTLLAAQYPPDFVAIPAGIGLSVLLDPDRLTGPIKSRYVLLDSRTSDLASTMTLEPIGELSYGTLYANRGASCP